MTRIAVGAAIACAFAPAGSAQVQWPEKKVRVVDGSALYILAQKFRAEIMQENQELSASTNKSDDTCLEGVSQTTVSLYAEERQTWRLANVGMFIVNPVDEETSSGQLFDELQDAISSLDTSHKLVGIAEAFCSTSPTVLGAAERVEALEGEYRQIVTTLQQRIGPVRPGLPNP